jgi:MFS family permease
MSTSDNEVLEQNPDRALIHRGQRLRSTIGAFLIMIAFSTSTTGFGLLVPAGAAHFHTTLGSYLVQYSLIAVLGAAVLPFVGRTAQRVGIRALIIGGGLWSAVGMIVMSLTTELAPMYLAAAFIGIGWGFCTVIPATIVVNGWNDHKHRGMVLGATLTGTAIGGIVWGLTIPALVAAVGWSVSVQVLALFVFLFIALTGVFLIRNPPNVVLPVGESNVRGATLRARRLRLPVALLTLGAFLISMESGILVLVSPVAQSKGLDVATAGLIVSYFAVWQIALKPIVGVVYDRFGYRGSALTMLVAYAVGFGGLAMVFGLQSIMIVIPFVALALTSYLVIIPLFVNRAVGKAAFAPVYSFVMTLYYVGAALSTPLWGAGFDLAGNYAIVLYGAVVLGSLGVVAMVSGVWLARRCTQSDLEVSDAAAPPASAILT